MANEEHLGMLRQGVEVWNQWRQDNPQITPDLKGAKLSEANLSGANLSYADLRGTRLRAANLKCADLRRADLSGADLREANLSGANLSNADFRRADLSHANLNEADLSGAGLSEANLSEASLREARLNGAVLSDANLGDAYLGNADLSGGYLGDAYLGNAYLSGANLSGANLSNSDFRGADLSGANLSNADLSGAYLRQADLSGANLSNADLSQATLVITDLTNAKLRDCRIYGASVWDVQITGAEQQNLIITDEFHPMITVDDLEVAQFIYLLLNHQKLRNVLNAVTERGVLLLGRFGGGGLAVLQAVAAKLREANYLPIIFDFERPENRNFTETVKTLAGLSRFIIADLSGPSVPQELYAIVPHFKIPFVFILEAGKQPFAMAVDLLEYPWVVRPTVTFASTEELVSLVPSKIVALAEEKHQMRQQLLDELFRRE